MNKILTVLLVSVSLIALGSSQEPPAPKPVPVNVHEMLCVNVGQDLQRCANPEAICYIAKNLHQISCFKR